MQKQSHPADAILNGLGGIHMKFSLEEYNGVWGS
jgi:hypothetical protein